VTVGDATLAGPAPRFSATQGQAPGLTTVGADSAELLAEAGYGPAELSELRAQNVIN
jgi:crotonobetainyl-CoA:carnitine CoA-transferase CaiB-like acyl-CoA transferase